jgi:5-methylcytosine-specific restriction endonuclease McrA
LAYWPPRPAPKIRVPVGVRLRALARSHDVCVMCLHREGVDLDTVTIGALRQLVRCGVLRAATQAHHVWPRQKWPNLIKVEANLTGLCRDCHSAHEFPGVKATRIPRAALPSCAIALAGDDGPMLGYLERVYPT